MPITKSAIKALRKTKRQTLVNRPVKSRVKTSIDALKVTKTADTLAAAFSAIDKALKKHLIHRNKAARLKSKASKFLAK